MKKVALITGASRGIGKAIAEEFAIQGYNIVINYNKSVQKAIELIEKIKQLEKLHKFDYTIEICYNNIHQGRESLN